MDGMKRSDLLAQIALGEDSTRQFKADVNNADSLASKMAAFANSNGGTLFIGVADDGSTAIQATMPKRRLDSSSYMNYRSSRMNCGIRRI
jgi:predicted HTH transcriptional regulator